MALMSHFISMATNFTKTAFTNNEAEVGQPQSQTSFPQISYKRVPRLAFEAAWSEVFWRLTALGSRVQMLHSL
ncbi:hypothetical protein CFK40_00970 [Virgibacillus necropolis]|uniref:Uncharacterized protein n=1 Tax=Virgibacillus necropolis TaxID=163877 RepID=A0A221M7S5_9BACI|nr:hypothetical protein CFK40_00970 [Virgibacillus necropolis]